MTRYKILMMLQLEEYYIGTTHKHKAIARVIEFEDSRLTAEKQYDFLEREILKLVAMAEKS